MSGIILTFPILRGKVEAWRRFCQEISGSRQQMYIDSRRRLGITYERLALVETSFGSTAVTTIEASDIGRAFYQITVSNLPFDRWYREHVHEIHGINLAGYEQFVMPEPIPENQELLFEWELTSSVGG